MVQTSTAYPVSLSIDYPDRNLNRLTSFFRIFTAIPILIIIGFLLSSGGCGLPPKKESSIDVRLELKIKGVNHGQEIAFSGADYQQVARS